MKIKVEVDACDIDKKYPAKTYTVTADDGRSVSMDLCAEHAAPFEEWLEEASGRARPIEQRDEEPPEAEEEPESPPVVPVRRQRKAAPEKATSERKTVRRRPRVTSLEEIEAAKNR
ncbi:hypothetical protein OH733_05500 [Streptomyces griseus]|uniref:hypothetical protein n=1 Tax=Streptomyces griseus TaxID=1911 RepID=UPI0038675161|nr:hypothetical protein OH733_05500 [Streptomyces griseus]WTD71155.1 hypothetical protein OH763_31485 [Streptomyces griseus]